MPDEATGNPYPCPRCSGQNPNMCACLTFCGHEFCAASTGPAGGEEGGFSDEDHPVGALMADPVLPCTRWTTDRITMINALRGTPHGRHLTLSALGDLADAVLARLPEASADAEISRLKAEITEKDRQLAILRGQVTT